MAQLRSSDNHNCEHWYWNRILLPDQLTCTGLRIGRNEQKGLSHCFHHYAYYCCLRVEPLCRMSEALGKTVLFSLVQKSTLNLRHLIASLNYTFFFD